MRTTTCFCDALLSADDAEALVPIALAHFTDAHPELGLEEHHIRDYLEAEDRVTGPAERLPEIGAIEIHETTPQRLDDVLAFFDHDAFVGNLGWAACYCMAHHVGGGGTPEWMARTAAENRAELIQRLGTGTTTGILAYVDGRLAAWCNASPRSTFPEHVGRDDHHDDEIGSIVCFVIAPPYRRHGLASRLLAEACRSFSRRGIRLAEAYPLKDPRDDATAYRGPLALYLEAGFEPVEENGGTVVVQRRVDGDTG